LGYQFVFNDRWSIDLVLIEPYISNYNFKAQLQGDFDFDPENGLTLWLKKGRCLAFSNRLLNNNKKKLKKNCQQYLGFSSKKNALKTQKKITKVQ
jgi:hypothetical protein